ncbi:phosphodiester glycosidase family protein [Brasilonema octagenarum UFV-E1]|uniref:Phosphodiester glycosidase family protein n=1 Tax=Brasilonema sennae CENA114 TaxID=415709 RepID=A0A856MGX0_9CYAN|nr:phosphodiester glycosidase family protein [Brasilonema sennae]QDL09490.1 phosphodiester glycosidase family protein [Brasilonema sennae CENA114]QDL15846.1 phosphodiester glycosidase family protein [Brasilonema octagenarum UFV-E1]
MHYRYTRRLLLASGIGLLALLLSPLMFYGWRCFLRPPRTDMEQVLFRGIVYKRNALSTPRPAMIHIVTIDLKTPGVKPFVTPGEPKPSDRETSAQKTSDFLKKFKLQLAINTSYFHHFYEKSPWDYYPRSGDPSHPLGEAISNGYRYSSPEANFPVLCFSVQNRVQILKSNKCPERTVQGVAGNQLLVYDGKPINESSEKDKPYPRVAAAVNREGTKLWLIAVDGKQPLYSEGITMAELRKIVASLGVHTALNLDGGGSTTLVMGTNNGSKVLNAPIHTRIPMRQRPVANHLGFFAAE